MKSKRLVSRNRGINSMIVAPFKHQERERIDAEFEAMADDEEYLALMHQVDAEWSPGSDEAMRAIARAEVLDGITYRDGQRKAAIDRCAS